ncbi:macro domain-containing protein [Luteolibacter ambystomatis]|uniref:Macro domain-containing protein n=1 Tax=Luteolibacter ambystomatis TaxID=2824561 RepID=A0A975PG47_9BACT|nr:macro domain-containing protein [Luteolibacter ambystomatis]QUE52002.1 macro domain-containing protein [Luteolibacter ambystomatis]
MKPNFPNIRVLIGDMFASDMRTLVNTVNCVGVMGKGIAQIFKKEYPTMFEDYAERCARDEVRLGEPYHYKDLGGISIVNFPTKGHWRAATRLEDVEAGLNYFLKHFRIWGVESIAFPPLGCGNGGLEWATVGPLMYSKLKGIGIPVEIYAPYGTPASQLKEDFLGADQQLEFAVKGRRREKLRPEWAALMEVLYDLEHQPYANPVGRTIFQKICYILTKQGLDTGFQFERNSYGPFADEVKEAINVLANNNWVIEQQLGKMTALKVGPEYAKARLKLAEDLKPFRRKIDKTVDLFSRIKNTDQAEEVATVIFAVQVLKHDRKPDEVSEADLFDYILEWKKLWRKDLAKQQSLADAIRNLEMLGWVKLQYSDSLPISG